MQKHTMMKRIVTVISLLLGIYLIGMVSESAAYNKPWDQGHDSTNPDGPDDQDDPCDPPCDPCTSTGSPVYFNDGNLVYRQIDFQISGPINIEVSRIYNAKDDRKGLFGHGWTLNYEMKLLEVQGDSEAYAMVLVPSGQRYKFVKNDESFIAPLGSPYTRLVKESNGELVLTHRMGKTYTFLANGYLKQISDRNGNTLNFTYDAASDCLESISDDAQRTISFTKGTNGKIASITDPANNVYQYGYDSAGNLSSYTDPLGNIVQFNYNTNQDLSNIVDPRGNTIIAIAYDTSGRVASYQEGGNTFTYQYVSSTLTRRVEANGSIWQYFYDEFGRIVRIVNPLNETETRQYGANGRIARHVRFDGSSRDYTYNSEGYVTGITDSLGRSIVYAYDPDLNEVTSTTLANHAVILNSYDAKGNLVEVKRDPGGALESRTSYAYNIRGLMTVMTEADGRQTTYSYDQYGNRITITDPLGRVFSRTYDIMGNVLTDTNPIGQTTSFQYDKKNNLIQIIDPFGRTTSMAYDAAGNLVSLTDSGNGKTTTFSYSQYNQNTRIDYADGTYTLKSYYSDGQIRDIRDRYGRRVSYQYDVAGKLLRITDPSGHSLLLGYTTGSDSRVVSITDPGGYVTQFTYNLEGELVSKTDALGNVTNHELNAIGLRTATIDPNTNRTEFTYDLLGRKTAIVNPNGHHLQFVYNNIDQLIQKQKADGSIIQYQYDAGGRLIQTSYADNTVTRQYDFLDNLIALRSNNTDQSYTYNNLSRLIQITDNLLNKSVQYTYDNLGRRTRMTGPEGVVTTYSYDGEGNLVRIAKEAEEINLTYDNRKRLIRVQYVNGSFTQYQYDNYDRIVSVENYQSNNTLISKTVYQFNGIGLITAKTNKDGDTISYQYDGLYRLTLETKTGSGGYTQSFVYDAAGNRIQMTADGVQTSYTYDSANRLTQEVRAGTTTTYTYDENGNLIRKDTGPDTYTYAYNAEDLLVRYDAPGTINDAAYSYDAEGKRISTVRNGATTRYLYDVADWFYQHPLSQSVGLLNRWMMGTNILAEYNGANALTASYVNGLNIDSAHIKQIGGQPYYYMKDMLGSVEAMVDQTENVINTYSYDAFGNIRNRAEGVANQLTYTGRELDSESELYYLRNRHYDPAIGRFIQKDPLTGIYEEQNSPLFTQILDQHAYGYAGQNPVLQSDAPGTSLIIVCSLGLPVCSAAIFCSANAGACSGGIVCSANVGACSGAVVCSGTVAGACSGGVVCSGNAAGACSAAALCSGQVSNGLGACSASAVGCSGQIGAWGAAACSANIAGACSGQAGIAGAGACSANLAGVCSGQVGAVGASVCSVQAAGACSGQAGGQVSVCSGQLGGACSGQAGAGPGVGACSGQIGGACSGVTGVGGPSYNACSGQAGGSCSAGANTCASAKVDASGNCCNNSAKVEDPSEKYIAGIYIEPKGHEKLELTFTPKGFSTGTYALMATDRSKSESKPVSQYQGLIFADQDKNIRELASEEDWKILAKGSIQGDFLHKDAITMSAYENMEFKLVLLDDHGTLLSYQNLHVN
jgi:RHS repeat-associated protein